MSTKKKAVILGALTPAGHEFIKKEEFFPYDIIAYVISRPEMSLAEGIALPGDKSWAVDDSNYKEVFDKTVRNADIVINCMNPLYAYALPITSIANNTELDDESWEFILDFYFKMVPEYLVECMDVPDKKTKKHLYTLSDPYIFNGNSHSPLTTFDFTLEKENAYATRKLRKYNTMEQGMELFLESTDKIKSTIIRTANIFSDIDNSPISSLMGIMYGFLTQNHLTAVSDNVCSFTYSGDLFEFISRIVTDKRDIPEINFANSGLGSDYDFAVLIYNKMCDIMSIADSDVYDGIHSKQIPLNVKIHPVPLLELKNRDAELYGKIYDYPYMSALDITGVRDMYGEFPMSWQSAVWSVLNKITISDFVHYLELRQQTERKLPN